MELDTRTKIIIQSLSEQRNNMADTVCSFAGEVAVLKEQLAEAMKKIDELKPKESPTLHEVA